MKGRRMGRSPCCNKQGLKKGPWTPDEDKILVDFIHSHGHGSWRSLPNLAGLQRCGKSCRLRWTNYLRPDIKRGPFTSDEQKSILQLHAIVGNKWSTIAAQIPGRTDNEIKNYWNTHLKKQLLRMGLDPDTYAPATSGGGGAATRHMAQWESARLEAEARLSRAGSVLSPVSGVAGQQHYREGLSAMKSEAPDVFLRLWNSDIGDAFRKVGEELSTEGSCSKQMSGASNAGRRKEVESIRCELEDGSAATADSLSSNVGMQEEEESYKIYFDFGGEEMSLLHGCLGGYTYSLFASDLDEASLDTAFE